MYSHEIAWKPIPVVVWQPDNWRTETAEFSDKLLILDGQPALHSPRLKAQLTDLSDEGEIVNKSIWVVTLSIACATALSGCVTPSPRYVRERPAPPPVQDVYVYPNNGQSDAQVDRDRYECHQWAVKQSHFDPSLVATTDAPQVHVVGPPPGAATAAGAVTGAVIGAAVSGPRSGPGGALFGAVAGAIIGSAADQERQEQMDNAQRHYDREYAARLRPAQDYRRAIGACLEARGYTVK